MRKASNGDAFGFPQELSGDVMKVLGVIRGSGGDGDERRNVAALSVLAHIAVLINDVALADGVAEVCMDRARALTDTAIIEIVARLVECSGAIADPDTARTTLARRLEVLSLALPSNAISGLVSAIESLRRIQPLLAPLLGRPLAAARLALPRPTAA
jgi:hypothetical protein